LSEAKAPEHPLFSRVLSHKTTVFFYFPFSAESLDFKPAVTFFLDIVSVKSYSTAALPENKKCKDVL